MLVSPSLCFQVLRTFVGAFDADRRTVASFGLSPVVGAWCSVWDAVPAGIHSWLEEEEKMEKKVEQLMEEEKKLQAQLEEVWKVWWPGSGPCALSPGGSVFHIFRPVQSRCTCIEFLLNPV